VTESRAFEITFCPLCHQLTADIHCVSDTCAWALCDCCWVWIDAHGNTTPCPDERAARLAQWPDYEETKGS